jgi:hypothetical protein
MLSATVVACLVSGYERQQGYVPSTLDGDAQTALLALGQASLLAGFYLPVDIHVTLQGLEVLVVKKRYVSLILKYLCHKLLLL